MKATVTDRAGRTWAWAAFERAVPDEMFATPEHLELCGRLLSRWPDNARDAVLLNTVALKSRLARALTAFRVMWRAGLLHPASVRSPWDRAVLAFVLGIPIPPEVEVIAGARTPGHLGLTDRLRWTAKVGAHRLWRLQGLRGVTTTVLRGFNELALRPFEPIEGDLSILLFPGTRWGRQRRARELFRERGVHFRHAGLGYRWRDLWRFWWARGDALIRTLAAAERNAGEAYARELREARVTRLLATDEFDLSSYSLHLSFLAQGGQSTTGAHGAGLYAPCLGCGEFLALSSAQERYYAAHSPGVRFRRVAMPVAGPDLPDRSVFRPAVVLIDQFATYREGANYAKEKQREMFAAVIAAAHHRNIPVVIKAHPSMPESARTRMVAEWGCPVHRGWAEIGPVHPIVFLLNSTILWELEGVMPVWVFKEGLLEPELYFGEGISMVGAKGVGEAIAACMDAAGWSAQVVRQRGRPR